MDQASTKPAVPDAGTVFKAAVTHTVKNSFPKNRRLLRHADFERVYKDGRRHFASHLTVFYVPRLSGTGERGMGTRIGFTVSKALGGAVERNRMKRRLREAVRLQGVSPGPDADIVINPKRTLLAVEFSELRNELAKAFVAVGKTLQRDKR